MCVDFSGLPVLLWVPGKASVTVSLGFGCSCLGSPSPCRGLTAFKFLRLVHTWTSKVCKIIAFYRFWASILSTFGGLGRFFLWSLRRILGLGWDRVTLVSTTVHGTGITLPGSWPATGFTVLCNPLRCSLQDPKP